LYKSGLQTKKRTNGGGANAEKTSTGRTRMSYSLRPENHCDGKPEKRGKKIAREKGIRTVLLSTPEEIQWKERCGHKGREKINAGKHAPPLILTEGVMEEPPRGRVRAKVRSKKAWPLKTVMWRKELVSVNSLQLHSGLFPTFTGKKSWVFQWRGERN